MITKFIKFEILYFDYCFFFDLEFDYHGLTNKFNQIKIKVKVKVKSKSDDKKIKQNWLKIKSDKLIF